MNMHPDACMDLQIAMEEIEAVELHLQDLGHKNMNMKLVHAHAKIIQAMGR